MAATIYEFGVIPNWGDGISITYSYNTAVLLVERKRWEQRKSLFPECRRSWSMTRLTNNPHTFDNKILYAGNSVLKVMFPVEVFTPYISSTLKGLSLLRTVEKLTDFFTITRPTTTSIFMYHTSARVGMFFDLLVSEPIVDDYTLQFANPLFDDYASGWWGSEVVIYPAITCIATSFSSKYYGDKVAEQSISFTEYIQSGL
jgi:hypothetical protein